jgi:hypothetical protein
MHVALRPLGWPSKESINQTTQLKENTSRQNSTTRTAGLII